MCWLAYCGTCVGTADRSTPPPRFGRILVAEQPHSCWFAGEVGAASSLAPKVGLITITFFVHTILSKIGRMPAAVLLCAQPECFLRPP